MENKAELSSTEIYQHIADLISWIYEVRIDSNAKAEIERHMLAGWYNDDRSEQDLVDYLVNMYGTVQQATGDNVRKLRDQARTIFRRMIEKGEQNDRGRVVAAIHQVVEGISPGVTGVPLQLSDPTTDASVSSPGYQPPVPSTGANPPQTHVNPAPSHAGGYGGHPQQQTFQPAPPQSAMYQQPATTPYQQPPTQFAGHPPPQHGHSPNPFGGVQYDLSGARDLSAIQRGLNRDIQQSTLNSNIEKQIHEMNMSIIKNIG